MEYETFRVEVQGRPEITIGFAFTDGLEFDSDTKTEYAEFLNDIMDSLRFWAFEHYNQNSKIVSESLEKMPQV